MSRPEINPPQARNWRDIPQELKPRAMSSEGRRRRVWSVTKTLTTLAVIGGIAWGGYEIAATMRGAKTTVAAAEPAVPVKEVVLTTDGVLDQRWLVRTLAIAKGTTLMQLDLYRLRERLLASGQVKSATLTRNFPATLSVSISEQSPVVRVKPPTGEGDMSLLLVARDGTVFTGEGFDNTLIESLPWLEGVDLTRLGERYAPIAGLPLVASLLGKAKLEADHLYRTWRSVSLARLESDREIEVHADGIAKIRFGTNEDFFRQLARLDLLLDTAREKTDQPLSVVNLAIGAQVPVAFEEPIEPTDAKAQSAAIRLTPAVAKPGLPAPSRKQKL